MAATAWWAKRSTNAVRASELWKKRKSPVFSFILNFSFTIHFIEREHS
jgi:hypothetical protein